MGTLSPEIINKLEEKQQAHVLKFYNAGMLNNVEIESLQRQLDNLDLNTLETDFCEAVACTHGQAEEHLTTVGPLLDLEKLYEAPQDVIEQWQACGLKAISQGQVCAVILSGGQGTRLGFSGPKGVYDIGLDSKKSLFQLFAERIIKLQKIAKDRFDTTMSRVHLLIMTSPMNHDDTVQFFVENQYFGIDEENIGFFTQNTMPCLSDQGKLILENSFTLATAPDGNGGFYKALHSSGKFLELRARNIAYVHVFSVDNALCKVADPIFLGYCITKGADCGNKVVWKTHADEKVGVVARKNSKPCVIEYSEMDQKMKEEKDDNGEFRYGAGNVCNHFFTMDFLESVTRHPLKYHVAHKKIPSADENGKPMARTAYNGIKLETFIFDTFPLSKHMAVLAVLRENEFSPVKNKQDHDSPDVARQMLSDEAKDWLFKSAKSALSESERKSFERDYMEACDYFEISPLLSYCGEGLEQTVQKLHADLLENGRRDARLRLEYSGP